jgi:hypothetical protein
MIILESFVSFFEPSIGWLEPKTKAPLLFLLKLSFG